MRATLLSTLLLSSGFAAVAMAETLPVNVVGCISRKDAAKYADYAKVAPDFAADMIDRATCYLNKEPMKAVKISQDKQFTRYQVLSGHKVWMPNKR